MPHDTAIFHIASRMTADHGSAAVDMARRHADAMRHTDLVEAHRLDRVADAIFLIESAQVPEYVLTPAGTFADERLARVYEYWRDGKGTGPAMLRRDFSIEMLSGLVPMLNLVAVDSGGACRFRHRMVGVELVKRTGRDSTGKCVVEDVYGPVAKEVRDSFEKIATETRPYRRRASQSWNNQSWLIADAVELPLIEADGRVSMILRATSFSATHRPPAQRLTFQPISDDV